MIVLNGTRNFELLTTYVVGVLSANLNVGFPVSIYREYYPTMDENNLPALNVLLKSVDEIRRDSNTTVNQCVVSVIGYSKCSGDGVGNSLKSKTDLLKLMGQVNNIFSKRSSYSMVPNNLIQNIKVENGVFSTPQDYNANQMMLGQQELIITLTESNDDVFSDFLDEVYTEMDVDDSSITYISTSGVKIYNSNNTYSHVVNCGGEYELPDISYDFKNSVGDVVVIGTSPSVIDISGLLPDVPNVDTNGDTVPTPAGVPFVCSAGADATLTLNTSPFLTVASGSNTDISLVDQNDVDITPISVVGSTVKVNIPVDTKSWELQFLNGNANIIVVANTGNIATFVSGSGTGIGTLTMSTDGISYIAISYPFTPISGTTYYFKRSNIAGFGQFNFVE